MSFSEKLDSFFNNFRLNIGTAPAEHLVYLYADYVELITLFSGQNYVSTGDVIDRLTDEDIFRQPEKSENQAAANDAQEKRIDTIFRIINERALLFDTDYPFIVHQTNKLIIRDAETLSLRNKVYIYLLLSSSLNIFPEFQHTLTTEFEELCAHVLRNYLPSHAVVKSFGKRSDYTGTAKTKIKALAHDMKIRIDEDGFEEISVKSTQEEGLDLIGWIPFADNIANYIAILGQCACGKDWDKKLGETSRYDNFFNFHRLNPVHSMFIPYNIASYQKNTFTRSKDIVNRLIFERKRILNYLDDIEFFNEFESKLLVDRCVDFMEEIV